jgi:Na+-driven multidrug efflux pump
VCLEWWSFEIAQIVSGLMGEVALATQLITMQFAAFAFMMPLGISVGKLFIRTGLHVE